jgi:transcriptional regulator with XRE-family HTH domain
MAMSTKSADGKAMINNFQDLVDQIKETETFDKEVVRGLVSDQIDFLMKKEGVKKVELARRLGKSRAYVTKVLQGNANFTLDTLVRLARALGYRFEPVFVPQETEWKPARELHLSAKAAKATTCKTTLDSENYISVPLDTEKDADEESKARIVG